MHSNGISFIPRWIAAGRSRAAILVCSYFNVIGSKCFMLHFVLPVCFSLFECELWRNHGVQRRMISVVNFFVF